MLRVITQTRNFMSIHRGSILSAPIRWRQFCAVNDDDTGEVKIKTGFEEGKWVSPFSYSFQRETHAPEYKPASNAKWKREREEEDENNTITHQKVLSNAPLDLIRCTM